MKCMLLNLSKTATLCLFAISLLFAGVDEWTVLGPDGGRTGRIAIDPGNPHVLYVAHNPVYKTTDSALTWVLSSDGIPCDMRSFFCGVSLAPNHPNVVYAHG